LAQAAVVTRAIWQGVVDSFDADQGIGELAAGSGERFFFHAAAIADGSRRIAVGTPVVFFVVAGHLGRFEAAQITPR
jgi:cold shock CspA family protein